MSHLNFLAKIVDDLQFIAVYNTLCKLHIQKSIIDGYCSTLLMVTMVCEAFAFKFCKYIQ